MEENLFSFDDFSKYMEGGYNDYNDVLRYIDYLNSFLVYQKSPGKIICEGYVDNNNDAEVLFGFPLIKLKQKKQRVTFKLTNFVYPNTLYDIFNNNNKLLLTLTYLDGKEDDFYLDKDDSPFTKQFYNNIINVFRDNFHTEFIDSYIDGYKYEINDSSFNFFVPFDDQGRYFFKTFETEHFDISLVPGGVNFMTLGQPIEQMIEYMWDTTPFTKNFFLYFSNYVEASK